MPIDGAYVGMVDRETFDEWLRERAATAGAERRRELPAPDRDDRGRTVVHYRPDPAFPRSNGQARAVIGADAPTGGPRCVPGAERTPPSSPITRSSPPGGPAHFDPRRAAPRGDLSPDHAWVFPRADHQSASAAHKGFPATAVADLRRVAGLDAADTVRREGAPIPLRPLRRWDNGSDVLLAGDAAGVVAPASGEGIYYAMASGRLAAEAVATRLSTGDGRALATARRRFMRGHGRVFWILGMMQRFWYRSDGRRERFVSMCRDPDVSASPGEPIPKEPCGRARPPMRASSSGASSRRSP